MNYYSHLECHHCGRTFDKTELNTFCPDDNQPLVARYKPDGQWDRESLKGRPTNMWRYHEMLPVEKPENRITLGEGFTPLLELKKLGKDYDHEHLLMKDESGNPSGSFKARGLGMAVSLAKQLGVKAMCIPTAGNAGSALSAYCAKADIEAHIFMPVVTPQVFQLDCEITGAHVNKVNGNISDAGAMMKEKNDGSWFDVTTLKEPFRLEGKKTMGYEILEQMDWEVPDVVVYPTGGGTGLIGIWKALHEMRDLGWIDDIPTRMVAVQGSGCNPAVSSLEQGLDHMPKYENPAETIANGLRVPSPFGDRLMMKTLKESNGTALDVTEDEIKEGLRELATREGMFISPEGAAVWMAFRNLKASGWIKPTDKVVLLNTGSAYKYVENLY